MGCHGPEGHNGKEPRHEKKQRLTTSSRGDHDTNLDEKLRVEASPKNSSYKIPSGNFTNLERNQSDPEGGNPSGRMEHQGKLCGQGQALRIQPISGDRCLPCNPT